MKRFIDMGDQITEGVRTFAWWDTITDRFETFLGSQKWESKESFTQDFECDYDCPPKLDRYLRLIPDDWKPMKEKG